jgi:hypothetical protein
LDLQLLELLELLELLGTPFQEVEFHLASKMSRAGVFGGL